METAERATLSVPFTSLLKFSLLYDPNNNHKEAMNGYKYVYTFILCQNMYGAHLI